MSCILIEIAVPFAIPGRGHIFTTISSWGNKISATVKRGKFKQQLPAGKSIVLALYLILIQLPNLTTNLTPHILHHLLLYYQSSYLIPFQLNTSTSGISTVSASHRNSCILVLDPEVE